MKKEYTNGELTVVWQPEKCIHSENCANGLPRVFDPIRRPWVNMDGADTSAIADQVNKCPSGALSTYMIADSKGTRTEADIIECDVMPNGPIRIKGSLKVKLANGNVEVKEGTTAFCRCGSSENKPYCDGSHKRVGFEG